MAAQQTSKRRHNVAAFVDALAAFPTPNGEVFNPWAHSNDDDQNNSPVQRRERLLAHLSVRPRFVLIGEAPSYAGCRISGVAFTSERLIINQLVPRIIHDGTRMSTRPAPWSEPSATVIWQTLYELGIAESTVVWNAYPFHPHRPDEPCTNRTPRGSELRAARELMHAFLDLYTAREDEEAPMVVAVGRSAQRQLESNGVRAPTIRHPSMGGAREFRDQLRGIVRH
jgi:uracil-DNA glycosylase